MVQNVVAGAVQHTDPQSSRNIPPAPGTGSFSKSLAERIAGDSPSEEVPAGDSDSVLVGDSGGDSEVDAPASASLEELEAHPTPGGTDPKSSLTPGKKLAGAVAKEDLTAGVTGQAESSVAVQSDEGHPSDEMASPPSEGDSSEGVSAKKDPKEKTLADVRDLANSKKLNISNLKVSGGGVEKDIDLSALSKNQVDANKKELTDSLRAKGSALASAISDVSAPESEDKMFTLRKLLNGHDPQEAEKRRAQNVDEKLNYELTSSGEKIYVVARGSKYPKSVVDSKIRNGKIKQQFDADIKPFLGDSKLSLLLRGESAPVGDASLGDKVGHQLGSIFPESGATADSIDSSQGAGDKASSSRISSFSKGTLDSKDSSSGSKNLSSDKSPDLLGGTQQVSKQEVEYKNAVAREMVKNFASQFKDELSNYKPPLTKMSFDLNPANLGQVHMVIEKKGSDLQINVTSNANVMNIFLQNQQDLKDSLAGIGFDSLDLSFSSNGDSSDSPSDEEDNRDRKSDDSSVSDIGSGSDLAGMTPITMEIILPQYA